MAFWPFRKRKATAQDILAEILNQNKSKTGKAVNVNSALRVATVFACLRVISEGVAQVPLKIYRKDGKNREPAREHPLFDIIHRKPNECATSFQFRETLVFHAGLTGEAFAFINRGPRGRILELVNLSPSHMRLEDREIVGLRPKYFVKGKNQTEKEFPADAILHIKGPSWDGVVGMDVVKLAREAIGLSIATEEAHSKLHANGAKPGGLLSVEGTLEKDQYQQLKTWIDENYRGVTNSNETMILDHGAKFTQMAMTGVDAQHLETRRFQIEDVCRFFRVMPIMVGQSDKAATYASAEQMFLAHVVHTLSPWYERIEQAIDCQLLTDLDRRNGYYVKFSAQALLRGAMKDTADYLYRLANLGIMTRNEARELLELNPIEGLDVPLTPVNMATGAEGAENA